MNRPSFVLLGILAAGLASSYLGCGGTTDTVTPSPQASGGSTDGGSSSDGGGPGDAATGCHADSECSSDSNGYRTYCYSSELGGVGCIDAGASPCTADSQCASDDVCRVSKYGAAGTNCTAACTSDDDCPVTDTCTSDGHCEARTCDQCPSYFSCASGVCTIPACSQDSECSGGYCVEGSCSATLGICESPCA